MNKSFTLIELIFVIVIIGFLAVIAIPKFSNLSTHAKEASIKTVVNSVEESIENLHSKWLVNEDFTWNPAADGKDHNSDWNSTTGYPKKLDSGEGESKLFEYVLKVPVNACADGNSINCWDEYNDTKYEYIFNSNKKLKIEYNQSNGLLECINGDNVSQSDCEKIIY